MNPSQQNTDTTPRLMKTRNPNRFSMIEQERRSNESRQIGIWFHEVLELSKPQIKEMMRHWDSRKWKMDLEEKETARIYRRFKENMGEEKCYDNRPASELLFKARANNLTLNSKRWSGRVDARCDLCGDEREDLVHFLIDCSKLENKRDRSIMEKCQDADKENMAGKILFDKDEIDKVKDMLEAMWKSRKRQIKQIQQEEERAARGSTAGITDESSPNGLNLLPELPLLGKRLARLQ